MAADYAGVCLHTLRIWISEGLCSLKIKGVVMIQDTDLDDFISSYYLDKIKKVNDMVE